MAAPSAVRDLRDIGAVVSEGSGFDLHALEPAVDGDCQVVSAGLERPHNVVAPKHEPSGGEKRAGVSQVDGVGVSADRRR